MYSKVVMKILLLFSLLVICQAKKYHNYEDLIKSYQQELKLQDALYETFEGLKRAPFVPESQPKEELTKTSDSKNLNKIQNALHDVFRALKQFPIVRANYVSKIGIGNKEKVAKLAPDLLVTRLMYGF